MCRFPCRDRSNPDLSPSHSGRCSRTVRLFNLITASDHFKSIDADSKFNSILLMSLLTSKLRFAEFQMKWQERFRELAWCSSMVLSFHQPKSRRLWLPRCRILHSAHESGAKFKSLFRTNFNLRTDVSSFNRQNDRNHLMVSWVFSFNRFLRTSR